MSQAPQPPESLENRVTNLERGTIDLRMAAEALLQTAQIHQQNFETISAELQTIRQRQSESDRRFEVILTEQLESDRRFEIMLAELMQIKIDSDARFNNLQTEINGVQTEIRRIIDSLLNQPNGDRDSTKLTNFNAMR